MAEKAVEKAAAQRQWAALERAIAADRDDRLADVRHRNEPRRVSLRDSTTAFDTGSVRASVCVAAHPVDDER